MENRESGMFENHQIETAETGVKGVVEKGVQNVSENGTNLLGRFLLAPLREILVGR